MKLTIGIIVLFSLTGCATQTVPTTNDSDFRPMGFGDYWYQGKAELNRFELKQARYGEIREGNAVLIFVTEDFHSEKQVKFEGGDRSDVISVLKLNQTRKFTTGIYPYSTMTTVFTPLSGKTNQALKINTTVQEWCGHVYMQSNHVNDKLRIEERSYFQNEADRNFELSNAIQEDELWTQIRLNPNHLPVGEFQIIPSQLFIRLQHIEMKPESATAGLTKSIASEYSTDSIFVYSLQYKSIDRKLTLFSESRFPYALLGFEETYQDGFGEKRKKLTTKGKRTHHIMLDYWSKNSVMDSTYLKLLGLDSK